MSLSISSLQAFVAQIRTGVNDYLWQQSSPDLPLWKRFALRSSQIVVAIVRDLLQGQLSLRAMSLVFTTVIGFFPLLALTFAVLKGLGVHNALEPTLLALLQPLGDDANGFTTDILRYVDAIQVELIGITSVGLLLYFVLDMMRKIESSFNYIWAVRQGRSWSSRVSEYLFAVIVSPLLTVSLDHHHLFGQHQLLQQPAGEPQLRHLHHRIRRASGSDSAHVSRLCLRLQLPSEHSGSIWLCIHRRLRHDHYMEADGLGLSGLLYRVCTRVHLPGLCHRRGGHVLRLYRLAGRSDRQQHRLLPPIPIQDPCSSGREQPQHCPARRTGLIRSGGDY